MTAIFGKSAIPDCIFICLSFCPDGESCITHGRFHVSSPNFIYQCIYDWYRTLLFSNVKDQITRSNIQMAVTSLIVELKRQSKAKNARNALGYSADTTNSFSWKCLLWRYFCITFRNFKIFNIAPIVHKKRDASYANFPQHVFFMLMMLLITSHRDEKISRLYSCLNEFTIFSRITRKRLDMTCTYAKHL